jgi:hypothetical protein
MNAKRTLPGRVDRKEGGHFGRSYKWDLAQRASSLNFFLGSNNVKKKTKGPTTVLALERMES